MFIVNDNMNITISRGDTAVLEVTFSGDAPGNEDRVVASLKQAPGLKKTIWKKDLQQVEGNVWSFQINEEDTQDLSFGDYSWDIRIFYDDGTVVTPFAPAVFTVLQVVTDQLQRG